MQLLAEHGMVDINVFNSWFFTEKLLKDGAEAATKWAQKVGMLQHILCSAQMSGSQVIQNFVQLIFI